MEYREYYVYQDINKGSNVQKLRRVRQRIDIREMEKHRESKDQQKVEFGYHYGKWTLKFINQMMRYFTTLRE